MKSIRIGRLRHKDEAEERILSATINIGNFINGLSRYADIVPITAGPIKITARELKSLRIDYLLPDIYFTPQQFMLREKYQIETPFIIKLVQIHPSINGIIYNVPLLRKNDIIIAPCQYAKESFLRISDKFDVHVVPNFVDVKFIGSYRRRRCGDNRRIITYMGRLTEGKGAGVLIECLPEIVDKINNAHLNIIGPLSGSQMDGNRECLYAKRLARQVKKYKLSDRVHFLGPRFGPDKYRLLARSDIFINPTIAREELFPVANIEALACGVPIIATDWAGNKEIVRDGKNGYLVEVGYDEKEGAKINMGQLVSLAVKILKDKYPNPRLRENAIKTAQKYDYRRIVPKFIELLKKKKNKTETKNRWGLIKDRSPADFPYLFNSNFIFFIYSQCIANFKARTYGSLYKLYAKMAKEGRVPKQERHPASKHRGNGINRRIAILSKKIYNDYIAYLLLNK